MSLDAKSIAYTQYAFRLASLVIRKCDNPVAVAAARRCRLRQILLRHASLAKGDLTWPSFRAGTGIGLLMKVLNEQELTESIEQWEKAL